MITVIAKLDKSSRARLSWIQSFAASFGIVPKPIYGHIPLCPVEEADIPSRKAALEGVAPITVDVEKVDVLETAPAVAAMLADRNLNGLRKALGAEDSWTPHVELVRDSLVNPSWVCMAMTEMFQPFTATVDRIEFVRDTGRGFEVLDAVNLV